MKAKESQMRNMIAIALCLFITTSALAEETTKQSNKWKGIMTALGGAAGFAIGFVAGFAVSDDDVLHSEYTIYGVTAAAAAGGGIAGYFLGKHMDEQDEMIRTHQEWKGGEVRWMQ